VAVLCPAQGARTVGMGRALCGSLPAARRLFDGASARLGYDRLDVCANGPAERLNSTAVSQPAIFVASMAALERLREDVPAAAGHCSAAAGLSLGEYKALAFAGPLGFGDALLVVKARGEAMQAASDARAGTMVSVLLLEQPRVEEIVQAASAKGLVRIANYLCPGNLAVSPASTLLAQYRARLGPKRRQNHHAKTAVWLQSRR